MAEKKKKKKKKFIQDAIKRPGAFTAKAEKKGITTAQLQENVLSNPDDYDEYSGDAFYLNYAHSNSADPEIAQCILHRHHLSKEHDWTNRFIHQSNRSKIAGYLKKYFLNFKSYS